MSGVLITGETWSGKLNYHSSSGRDDAKAEINFKDQARDQLFSLLKELPGTAFVAYGSRRSKIADHGMVYVAVKGEEFTFTEPVTDTHQGDWNKSSYVTIVVQFKEYTI